MEHLDRYVIREDVQLRDTTDERNYLLIAGGVPAGNSHVSIRGTSLAATIRSCMKLIQATYRM